MASTKQVFKESGRYLCAVAEPVLKDSETVLNPNLLRPTIKPEI